MYYRSRREHGPSRAVRLALMIEARRNGASFRQIARRFHLSKSQVGRLLQHVPIYQGPQARRWIPECWLLRFVPAGNSRRRPFISTASFKRQQRREYDRLGKMILSGAIRDPSDDLHTWRG